MAEINDLPNDDNITGVEKILLVDNGDNDLGKTITVDALETHLDIPDAVSTENVQTALGISSGGSATEFLNETGAFVAVSGVSTTDQAKLDNISITQGVDLDAIESDTTSNTTHREITAGNPHGTTAAQVGALPTGTTTISTAQSDKLGFISVTGSIDLDNLPDDNTQLTATDILSVLNGATGNIDADLLTLASGGNNIVLQPTDGTSITLEEGDLVIASLPSLFGNWYEIGANPPTLTSASNFANVAFVLQYTNTDLKDGSVTVNSTTRVITGPGGSITIPTMAGEALEFTPADHDITEFRDVTSAGSGSIITAQERIDFAIDTNTQLTSTDILAVLNGATGNIDGDLLSLAGGDQFADQTALETFITDDAAFRAAIGAGGATGLATTDFLEQPTDSSTLAYTANQIIFATNSAIANNIYRTSGSGNITSSSMLGGANFTLIHDNVEAAGGGGQSITVGSPTGFDSGVVTVLRVLPTTGTSDQTGIDILGSPTPTLRYGDALTITHTDTTTTRITVGNVTTGEFEGQAFTRAFFTPHLATGTITNGDAITRHEDSVFELVGTSPIRVRSLNGGEATFDLRTTNKPAPNGEILSLGVGDDSVIIAGGDIKFRDFSTFQGGVANQNEVVRLPGLGRSFVRIASGVSPSIGGIALSTEALVLRTITENPDDWAEITLDQAHSLAQGERLPGDTGTGEIITDNGDGTFTDNRTNTPRTLTQITVAGSTPGDTWLLIDDDLPTAVDETTMPFGLWILTATPGGLFVWVFTGQLAIWNKNIAYVPNQIVQLIVGDESTTFEAHVRTGDTLPADAFNFGIQPGVTVGWEDLWTRINSYTNAARIRVVNTLPGGLPTQTTTPSYDDGRLVQDDDIVILSIPIADVLTTIVDKDTIPPGLYRFRILSPTQQTWIQSDRGLQWNSNLIYLQGEVVFNSVGSANAVETPYRALSTVGVNVEPGIHSDTDTFWQRLNPYVGELLEEVEDAIRVQQVGVDGITREQIDLFNNPATGNNVTPTHWRLTLNEGESDTANIATLPELISASKWSTAPTGIKPEGLTWDQLHSPVTHDSVQGAIGGGQELGELFGHPAVTDATELLFTFLNTSERDIVRDQYFHPNIRAIGPFPINTANAGIIQRTEDDNTDGQNRQLNVFFETGITVLGSGGGVGNIALYLADRALVRHIEGGTFDATTETLTITSGEGGTTITDVTSLPATATLNDQVRLVVDLPTSYSYTNVTNGGVDMLFVDLDGQGVVYDIANYAANSASADTFANLATSSDRTTSSPSLNITPFQLLGYRPIGGTGGTFLGRVDSTTGANGNGLRLRLDVTEFSVTQAQLNAIPINSEVLIATELPVSVESEYYIWNGTQWQLLSSTTTLTSDNVLPSLNAATGSIDADLLGNAPAGTEIAPTELVNLPRTGVTSVIMPGAINDILPSSTETSFTLALAVSGTRTIIANTHADDKTLSNVTNFVGQIFNLTLRASTFTHLLSNGTGWLITDRNFIPGGDGVEANFVTNQSTTNGVKFWTGAEASAPATRDANTFYIFTS